MTVAYTTLIATEELASQRDDSWAVVDCRYDLRNTDSGREQYLHAHIPGATYAHLSKDLSGPVGIARVTGEVIERAGWLRLIELAALLSLNLAIINILPLPMLDGGRIFFVLVEIARRGKRISPEREGLVHLAGFVALLLFVVVISYFDIVKAISGESLLE